MKKLLIAIIVPLVLIAAALLIPISSKDYVAFCKAPDNLKTRYNLFEKKAYDSASTSYQSPGSEVMDCAGVHKKITLHIL